MEEETKSMTVNIAGRSYPLRVKEDDKVSIQQVVDDINEKVKDFQLTYINKDKQDCLAMALLTYAVDYNKIKQDNDVSEKVNQKVDHLESMIDEIIK
ncbi:MAG: cell division protein ZapA [Saprospiraceae bacterium]|nr:cell division protein ZapA [Saprospiraceae bacterium]